MIPDWSLTIPWNIVTKIAKKYDLDPKLVGSFIHVESGGNSSCCRHEPNWHYFITPDKYARDLGITMETEQMMQATSWGLMQIMGSVAREHGFFDNLPKLIIPAVNLEFGCEFLKSLITKYPKLPDAVSSYNAGSPRKEADGKYSNQPYVDKVLAAYSDLI